MYGRIWFSTFEYWMNEWNCVSASYLIVKKLRFQLIFVCSNDVPSLTQCKCGGGRAEHQPDKDSKTRWEHAHSNLVKISVFPRQEWALCVSFFLSSNVDLNFHLQTFMETHTMRALQTKHVIGVVRAFVLLDALEANPPKNNDDQIKSEKSLSIVFIFPCNKITDYL